MRYYVDCHASSQGDGSKEAPFSTIQQAANLAQPGDEVIVLPGVYREAVHPIHKGREDAPIVYRSAVPLKAVIKGSEEVKNWVPLQENVWTARVPNRSFPERNPFTTRVSGDWFIASFVAHTGDVYLNGKSMYEVTDLAQVLAPTVSKTSWDPDFSVYTWFSQQDAQTDETVLYANFQGRDPNAENVEISVRPNCFFPLTEGVDYITLSGFTVTQAATQWAPPTAFQEGMVGPNWARPLSRSSPLKMPTAHPSPSIRITSETSTPPLPCPGLSPRPPAVKALLYIEIDKKQKMTPHCAHRHAQWGV